MQTVTGKQKEKNKMSRTTDWAIEMQEIAHDKKIAELLGIDYDELMSLEWHFETDESMDGLVYSYRIEFDEDSPKDILNKIERLEDGCRVYLQPWELDDEYDYDEQFEAITENKDNFQKFHDEIANLSALSGLIIPDEVLKGILNRQIFIGVIGTMETYLSDTFINLTFDHPEYFRNFIETHPEFEKRKFDLNPNSAIYVIFFNENS